MKMKTKNILRFAHQSAPSAIDSYFEYRMRHGELPLKENAPVIREEFDIHDEIRATRPRALGEQSFRKMIREIGLRIRSNGKNANTRRRCN